MTSLLLLPLSSGPGKPTPTALSSGGTRTGTACSQSTRMALGQAWHMAGPLGQAWHMAHGTWRMACRQSWDMLGAASCRCHSTGRHAGPCQELTAEPLTNRKVRRTSRSRGCPGRAERRGAERGRRRRRQRRRWAGGRRQEAERAPKQREVRGGGRGRGRSGVAGTDRRPSGKRGNRGRQRG